MGNRGVQTDETWSLLSMWLRVLGGTGLEAHDTWVWMKGNKYRWVRKCLATSLQTGGTTSKSQSPLGLGEVRTLDGEYHLEIPSQEAESRTESFLLLSLARCLTLRMVVNSHISPSAPKFLGRFENILFFQVKPVDCLFARCVKFLHSLYHWCCHHIEPVLTRGSSTSYVSPNVS